MFDLNHLISNTRADVKIFCGFSLLTNGNIVSPWIKPAGCSHVYILAVGRGGNGGSGAVGAASTAAGGGGGGSGGQTVVLLPAALLPDELFIHLTGAGVSAVLVSPNYQSPNDFVCAAAVGSNGGNASGATAGTAGATGVAFTIPNMPLAGMGKYAMLSGQVGVVGGTTGNAAALTLPVTGILVTGGTGGGGCGATTGGNGGAFTVAGIFPPHSGGIGSTVTGTPGGNGSNGWCGLNKLDYAYGGTGGGAGYANSGGAGGTGGAGGYGCGGGGGGGGFTGSTIATGGIGGGGYVIIISW